MRRLRSFTTGTTLAAMTTQLQESTAALQRSTALQIELRNELSEYMSLVNKQAHTIRWQAQQISKLKQRLGITESEPF
jgi:uncharacterized lipoprotein YmbA